MTIVVRIGFLFFLVSAPYPCVKLIALSGGLAGAVCGARYRACNVS